MTRPGFRKARPGGGRPKDAAATGEGFLSSSLFSQAQILHMMKNEFARSRRHRLPLGCALMQVDRIAQLVDMHGAELRHALRAAIAELVRGKTRGADLLGATNDDRYLLVLPHTNLEQTRVVVDRLHQQFRDVSIAAGGRELALTLSIGISACDHQETLFFDTFVAQAEVALEFAVQHGGDQVVSFGETQLRGEPEPPPENKPPKARRKGDPGRGGAS
jgi:diguanylate cyclase (GGDEF)-like protein